MFLLAIACAPAPGSAAPGKLIATGWDSPNAAEFRIYAAEFEKWPFDGVTIFPTVKRLDGTTSSNGYAFSRERWDPSACREMTADLAATRSRLKADSFLFCYSNPGDVDWFEDSGWAEIVDHWRQLARAARQGGLRGLLFDAEPYTAPYRQFNDTGQIGAARHTFEEYAAQARKRGRQVMGAVAAEYPGATIFSYRLLSDLLSLTGKGGDPRQALSGNTYALLPAFVDGWLDVAPTTITLIEGDEDIGYRANDPATFDRAYARLRMEIPALLDPVNVGRYRNQVLISHGLYLDAYTNPPGSPWYIDPLGGTPADRLEANTAAALRAADSRCVWIYGETGRWWPQRPGTPQRPAWPDKLKSADTALLRAKDPVAAARAFLMAAPRSANLLKNGDFSLHTANGLPADWWIWQDEKSNGQPAMEKDAAQWSGTAQGAVGQNVSVKPGRRYAVSALLLRSGRGSAIVSLGWKNAQVHWSNAADNVQLLPETASRPGVWREACGIVTAPPGSAFMIVMFAASGQGSAQDRAMCRDFRCVEMP